MSAALCPQGHPSAATDYCDVCGTPMSAATAAPEPAPATPDGTAAGTAADEPGATACPNCGTPAAAGALFCENCGYDFSTGALPDPAEPAAPAAPEAPAAPGPAAPGGPAASAEASPGAASPGEAMPAPGVPGPDRWVVEIWVDPDWYAAQQPEDPMPSVGLPGLVELRERSVLVGRPSTSRGIHPQVDCGADTGVSRRHCQLSTDGQRWWVEDLQSSNGTYVAPAGEPLPTDPLPPGERRELAEGDHLYLGAWTRLVVRRALPGEV